MKALVLIAFAVILCVVLFVAGVIAPDRSKRMQARANGFLRKGERAGDQKAGRFGDMTQKALEKTRKAGNASARNGRKTRSKLFGG